MSIVAVVAILGSAWWLSLRVLDTLTPPPVRHSETTDDIVGLVGCLSGEHLPAELRDALMHRDIETLELFYERSKTAPPSFVGALVSLALSEIQSETAKAYRGLETVRLLRRQLPSTDLEPKFRALDLLEARLRLMLADVGQEPRQRQFASQILDRLWGPMPGIGNRRETSEGGRSVG